jgi:hypothetical protein
MSLAGDGRDIANRVLSHFNVVIGSLTSQRAEEARLAELIRSGHFDIPVFPVLPQVMGCDPSRILQEIGRATARFDSFGRPEGDDGFQLDNHYYGTPDAEAAHAIVHLYKPRRIVEIGSGNSTRLLRASAKDAGLDTRITSIDPSPRRELNSFADEIIPERLENFDCSATFAALESNDILFVDSSHHAGCGTDVTVLMLSVLPRLPAGVLVHFHDIFLPYDYPSDWVVDFAKDWNEQYLIQALLTDSTRFEVLWPGHYLQRTVTNFPSHFKQWKPSSRAQSFWMIKRG